MSVLGGASLDEGASIEVLQCSALVFVNRGWVTAATVRTLMFTDIIESTGHFQTPSANISLISAWCS
jgi:hypothetical protein